MSSSITMSANPKDCTDFSFVKMRPIQLPTNAELENEVFNKSTQLLTVGNKIGLVFAGWECLYVLLLPFVIGVVISGNNFWGFSKQLNVITVNVMSR
jgi:hypothetical protein